jgi:uncharacterized protein (UPF0261 family)
MPPILAFATCDTKGEEVAYLAARIRAAGGTVTTVDVGTQRSPSVAVDVPRTALLAAQRLPAKTPTSPASTGAKQSSGCRAPSRSGWASSTTRVGSPA